ncbi:hypothetical protein TcCL_NonESM05211 [Trypanosoma cruzi]|nr:hypothetical protein TcCL_NonESM05211 [Trypanosoma cruzi]
MRKANEVAREMCAPSTWEQRMSLAGQFTTFLPHARTHDERGELCGLFDGNRSGAIDPTAVRQDAAVHVGNGSNPAGHGDSGATKIVARSETKQTSPVTEEEMNQVIRSRTDWKERVVLRLAWITASRWSEIAVLTPQQFHTEGGRGLNFGFVRRAKDGEGGSPPCPAFRQETRAGRFRHYKAMQDTSTQRKAHEYYDYQSRTSPSSLGCHGAFHKTRCVAARCSNRGDIQFGSTRDLAVGEARQSV